MSDHAKPATPLSPKVLFSLLVGLLLTGLAAILSAITPDMLVNLGPYSGVAFTLIGVLSTALTAYLKRDPLRDTGQLATEGTVIKGEVVPEAADVAAPELTAGA